MDAPPDGGYGWVVVGAIFWNNAHHWGLVSVSLSQELRPVTELILFRAMEFSLPTFFQTQISLKVLVLTMHS